VIPFFPDPQSERRESAESQTAAWIAPPTDEIPVPVAVDLHLARSAHAALRVSVINVYSIGCEFEITSLTTEERDLHWPGKPRFGISYPDGTRVIAREPDENPSERPAGPVLASSYGRGQAGRNYTSFWLWPLPASGALTLVVDWPGENIEETTVVCDTQRFLEAVSRVVRLREYERPARDLGKLVCRGTVKFWNEDDGWGIITSPEVPGEVWAHFSHIDAEGYRSLEVGERVQFKWLQLAPPGQDGYLYRATRVVRLRE
jgi:cold shock protein